MSAFYSEISLFLKPIHNENGCACLRITMSIAIPGTLTVELSSSAEVLAIVVKNRYLEVTKSTQQSRERMSTRIFSLEAHARHIAFG